MRRIIILVCAIIGIFQSPLQAQILPIPNHFVISPYTYNPSMVGFDQYVEVQLIHKQQWVGIENAPSLTNLTFQMPFSRQINFGGNLMFDKNGLFENTMAVGTFGYMLPLGYRQNIRFGLSGGFYSQQYDASSSSNPSDPAIANYENSFRPMGSFGVTYQYGTAHIGVALPNLFSSTFVTDIDIPTPISNREYLSQMIVSGGMKMDVNEDFKIEPSAIFRYIQNDNSLLEIATLVHYQDFLWAGGSYRLESGPSILLGGAYQNFRFGYAHELATNVVNGFGGGSHEFFLSYRIGSKKTFENVVKPPKKVKATKTKKVKQEKPPKEKEEKKEKVTREKQIKNKESDTNEAPKVEETIIEADTLAAAMIKPGKKKKNKQAKNARKKKVKEPKAKKQPKVKKSKVPKLKNIKPADNNNPSESAAKETEPEQVQETPVIVADQQKKIPDAAQQKATEENFKATRLVIKDPNISKGYYVTVGVFAEEANAIEYKNEMKKLGFKDSDYIFSSIKNYNYVYVLKTKDLTDARVMWLELRSAPGFEETWVYTVEVQ